MNIPMWGSVKKVSFGMSKKLAFLSACLFGSGSNPKQVGYGFATLIIGKCMDQCFGSGWNRVFSPIRIRVLKVRIRPFINLCDLNDGFDKVLEEPDQKGQC